MKMLARTRCTGLPRRLETQIPPHRAEIHGWSSCCSFRVGDRSRMM